MPDVPKRKPPRRPRGKTKRWTEAELDRQSQVTPDDIEAARDSWKRHGGNDGFGPLLDATPDEEA